MLDQGQEQHSLFLEAVACALRSRLAQSAVMTGEQDGEGDGLPPAITGMDGKEDIAFWNLNIPPEQHTKECPDYLEYALTNDKDRALLSTPNSEYQRQSWDEVRNIILQNRLDLFVRIPSDLRKYREYNGMLEKEHGSVMQFVMKERLHWNDLTPKGKPFTEPGQLAASPGCYLPAS